jgi:large repetitive protein
MSRTISFFCALVLGAVGSIALLPAPAQAGTLGLAAWIRGAGTVSAVEGGSYSCSLTNGYNQNLATRCARSTFEAPLEAWVWLKATPVDLPAGDSDWTFAGWQDCDTTRVTTNGTECGVHSGAFTLDERTPMARFIDTRAPSVSITSGPANGSRQGSNSATFMFNSDDPLARLQCRLDSGAAQTCTSGVTYSGLAQGAHTLIVNATDSSGNVGLAALRTWTVDSVVPVSTITGGPFEGLAMSSKSAFFAYSSSEASQFFCRLDNAAFTACSGATPTTGSSLSYTNLTEGPHTFSVYAHDGLQAGPIVSRAWTVDTVSPDTVVVDGPSGIVNDSTPTFSFASLPASDGAAFECRLDGAIWQTCSGPDTTHTAAELAEGPHTFEVRARDGADNVDPTPASATFAVITTAPETVIARGPSSQTRDRTPTFKFVATREGSTFACKLDDGRYRACTSPWTTSRLSFGRHTVRVRATNAGITDPTPAQRSFKVVRPG